MTIFLLLRHAHSTANDAGILAGRTEGIHLSTEGSEQSKNLPKALHEFPINRFISSPLARCIETIKPTLMQRHKRLTIDGSFIEMDYGSWSGRELRKLRKEKGWKQIQRNPLTFTFPQGESFATTANRIELRLQKLSKLYPNETILIVTHGDIIKLATQITLEGDLNKFQKLVVDTCSLTVLDWKKNERSLVHFNQKLVKIKRSKNQKVGMKSRRVLGGGSGV
jgi:broad specificity phosphatase PhoE